MDLSAIKDWLVPTSTFVTLITVSIGSWLSLKEYRIKLQAETRLRDASKVEMDVKLLQLFTEIMNIAHARATTQLSEKIFEQILKPEVIKQFHLENDSIKDLLDKSIVILPVGLAAQDAAIAAIASLGKRHDILKSVAIQALESLVPVRKEVAEKHLKELK
jgi:hypothetical protein